ncbi:hypothetical protein B0H13DRAFT_2328010 [Mycena leptocephala]|nr:hypothetical protein B0H13DRAFT_2328010 [Mycena leptocephala]
MVKKCKQQNTETHKVLVVVRLDFEGVYVNQTCRNPLKYEYQATPTDLEGTQKSTVEECIDESWKGEFRKYINNNAPTPSSFLFDCENQNRAQFLAFSQHWQFRRTHGLAFVSDYQGGDTLLTDPQIMSDASLGDIFAQGNMPSDCKDFSKTHWCNKFCEYFQIAHNFDFPVDMSISVADRPLISSSNGKRKAQGDPDEIRATRRTKGGTLHILR